MQSRSANLARLLALAVSISAHALLLTPLAHRLHAPSTGWQSTPLAVELIAAPDDVAPPAPPPPTTAPPAPEQAEPPAPNPPTPVVEATVAESAAPPPRPSEPPQPPASEAPHQHQEAIAPSRRDYLAAVLQSIEAEKRYPAAARRRRLEGQVRVSFRLAADGDVTDFNCTGGHPWLCRAAAEAVAAAAPLPPVPPKMLGEAPLTVRFRMDYVLH